MLEMGWYVTRLAESPYANPWRVSSGVFSFVVIDEITKILISKLLLIVIITVPYLLANKTETQNCWRKSSGIN